MKLFLSSADVGYPSVFKYMKEYGNRYYLYSYYNLRGKKKLLDYLKVKGEVFLDSGAHTLQKPGKEVDWDKFIYEYIKFINDYKQYLDYIVELDVENKIGLPLVEKYRNKIKKETSIEPIVVWHRSRGFDYLKYMCKTYKYIGFSGFVEDKTGENEIPDRFVNTFCDMAHKDSAKVHGFGYTRQNLPEKRFDSIDSSSWNSGIRYGQLLKFKDNKMIHYKKLHNYNNKYDVISKWSVKEWIKYQEFLDEIR